MSQNSPNLDLPFLQPAQAQKHVTHNEALGRLDIVVQLRLQQTGATTPPATPADGEVYALGAGASGAWAGQDDMLAVWLDGVWQFLAPQTGWRAWDISTAQLMVRDESGWIVPQPALDNLDGVGIGTSADATNRLSVQAPATLLSHDGADHRLTVNKAATGDTASLLFQSGWTGHAEMGLTGQDAFSIKVSNDGATWTDALRLAGATGHATGRAVQSDDTDATQGRLLTVGAFGLGQTGTGPAITDIDATDLPAGTFRYLTGSPGAASLPPALQSGDGVVRIERHDASLLRQTVWRNDFLGGLWARIYSGGTWGVWRLIYDHSTILGPVSESGGLPTGALIEQGSNADGTYLRFADGTQICSRQFVSAASSHAWTFPLAFVTGSTPALQALPRHATAPRILTENEDLSATGVSFNVWDTSGAAAPAQIHASAIGRWF